MFGAAIGAAGVWLHGNPNVELRFQRLATAVGLLNEALVEDDEVRKLQLVERARELTRPQRLE
jgi:hypothetical protein